LFILEYFEICFYFHGHQKGAHLWQRGAIQGGATEVWGDSCFKLPPWIRHWSVAGYRPADRYCPTGG